MTTQVKQLVKENHTQSADPAAKYLNRKFYLSDGVYVFDTFLAEGGCADVIRAVPESMPDNGNRVPTDVSVAIKLARPHCCTAKEAEMMLITEQSRLASLVSDNHPHIIQYRGPAQMDTGEICIALEYCPWRSVEFNDELEHAVGITRAVGEAVDHLHKRGLLHRDICLPNVLVNNDLVVKLADLGLTSSEHRVPGSVRSEAELKSFGRLEHLPPEFLMLEVTHVGPVGEMYALGMLLYRLALQQYEGSPFTITRTHKGYFKVDHRPQDLIFPGHIPDQVSSVIRRGLEKQDKRYQTAEEFVGALTDLEYALYKAGSS